MNEKAPEDGGAPLKPVAANSALVWPHPHLLGVHEHLDAVRAKFAALVGAMRTSMDRRHAGKQGHTAATHVS